MPDKKPPLETEKSHLNELYRPKLEARAVSLGASTG